MADVIPQDTPHAIQLGVVPLTLDIGLPPAITQLPPPWTTFAISFLNSGIFHQDSNESIEILTRCLRDPGLGCSGEYRVIGNEVLVRMRLIPSDAPNSLWQRKTNDRYEREMKSVRGDLLRRLFDIIWKDWDGLEDCSKLERLMALTAEDRERMSDIYASIPSPPTPDFGDTANSYTDQDVHSRFMAYADPEGVKTNMHRYQLRSVAKMLQMETKPGRLVDPIFTSFKEAGREGEYYVNPHTWLIQRHPGWYDLPRGGILCEQMGTGKTLMCLALIVSTLHQPCKPPPNLLDISPIVTDCEIKSYPFEDLEDIRNRTGIVSSSRRLPSLTELCVDVLVKHDTSARRDLSLPQSLRGLFERNSMYFEYKEMTEECVRAIRKRNIPPTTKTYLANTTLIIVPQILIQQWIQEIDKHLVEGTVKVLQVKNHEELPEIEELIKYDIILMESLHFGMQETESRLKRGRKRSVLFEARWKRIIFDEGHVAGNTPSLAMHLAMALSVERRWLVSGTPTPNLQQGGDISMEVIGSIHPTPAMSRSGSRSSRQWSKHDLEDITRLGTMIGGFLAAEPFKSESDFQQRVTAPLRRPDGPEFGAVRRMKYILSQLMVKHLPGIIDMEAKLPPSTMITVKLQFDPIQRITHNVLAALVASNVYTSNFEDADYFLHPNNIKSFNQVIENIHLACFWYSAPDMDAHGCLKRIRHALENDNNLPQESRKRLEEAASHIQVAIDTPGWNELMSNGISIPYEAAVLPRRIQKAWSCSRNERRDLVDSASLLLLRELNVSGAKEDDLIEAGRRYRASQASLLSDETEKQRQREKKDHHTTGESSTAAKRPIMPKSPKKTKGIASQEATDRRLAEAAQNAARAASAHLPRPLPATIRTASRSTKVNYVISTILESPLDKFVIFGSNIELGHLTEAFDLADIKSCFAGHSISGSKRTEAIREFEKPDMQVCLLELKLAARGLNLVCANRMIFLGPVWNLDVQAQAIKRVHRIGQTRPTKVEILVTEGTFEEDIAMRSSNARSENEEKLYSRAMIENPRFVYPDTIERHRFTARLCPVERVVTPINSVSTTASTPVEILPTTPMVGRDGEPGVLDLLDNESGSLEDVEMKVDIDDLPRPRKRIRVAFEDD